MIAEQNYLNQLVGGKEIDSDQEFEDQEFEDQDPYFDYYEDEDQYDYEKERISAGRNAAIPDWLTEPDELPF